MWNNSVCLSLGRKDISNIQSFVTNITISNSSAIDKFYEATKDIIILPTTFFSTYSRSVTGPLFVGIISATENYFRDILGYLLTICPISQQASAEAKVQLGSLLWANASIHNRAAFEYMAFSSGENISKTINSYLKYPIGQNSTTAVMLKEYDKLCELRHAVVHSGSIIAGKNAIKLFLRKSNSENGVNIDYAALQLAAEVCTALVQSANNELFEMLVDRWADHWRRLNSWSYTSAEERKILKNIWDAFYSARDGVNGTIPTPITFQTFHKRVKAAYSL